LRACESTELATRFPGTTGIATDAHLDLEAAACTFFDSPAALYLPGGYYFGPVAIAALRDQFGTIFFDELTHFCMRDGIASSGLPNQPFRHLDADDLASKLKRHLQPGKRPLIVTDGMYSTFGQIAPLDQLAQVMAPYGGRLLVDESHSFGVLGALGRGASEHYHLAPSLVLAGGSLSKAFGGTGGVIPASNEDIDNLRRAPASRSSSVGLPAAASMSAHNLRYVRQHPELLQRLRANTSYVKRSLCGIGLDVGDTIAPVATFVAGKGQSMQELQVRLMTEGIFVLHSNYIGAGSAGVIRCGIFADHTTEHMDALVETLRRIL